jgi:hypothetical protein
MDYDSENDNIYLLNFFLFIYVSPFFLVLYWVLPAGISHVSPENPSSQVHSAVPSAFASAQLPPLLHGLGAQAIKRAIE